MRALVTLVIAAWPLRAALAQDELEAPLPAPAREAPRGLAPPRAPAGTWDGLFVDHAPDPARLAGIEPRLLQLGEWARQAYQAGDYPTAVELCLSQLELLPDFPPTLLLLGSTCFRLRRYDDCRRLLDRFLEVAPTELHRTQALGHALYGLGRHAEARDHYLAVLDVLPASVEARRGLGLALDRLGEQEAAAAALEAVVEARPGHGAAWAALARVRFDLDRLAPALDAAERAMAADPFLPEGPFVAFRVLFDLGRDAEAEALERRWRDLADAVAEVRTLRNRLLLTPRAPGLLTALARELAALGDRRSLVPVLERLVVLPGSDAQRLERGLHAIRCLAEVGDEDAARSNLQGLARLFPDSDRPAALGRELGLDGPPAEDADGPSGAPAGPPGSGPDAGGEAATGAGAPGQESGRDGLSVGEDPASTAGTSDGR